MVVKKKDIYVSLQIIANIIVFETGCHHYTNIEMLSRHFSIMDEEQFRTLPTSTNTVESHNRLSKADKPEILRVAMLLTTYKVDMAVAYQTSTFSRNRKHNCCKACGLTML